MSKVAESWSARQQRHLSFISEFTTNIQHISGKTNVVADTLSRVGISTLQHGVDYSAIAEDQLTNEELQTYCAASTALQLQHIELNDSGKTILCDVSTGTPRPVIPQNRKKPVFNLIHGLSHPGVKATRRLMTEKFVWHNINKEVSGWARNCIACQRSKIHRHIKAPLLHSEITARRFHNVNVDLTDDSGPIHKMAGSYSVIRHVNHRLRSRFCLQLDCAFWHSTRHIV